MPDTPKIQEWSPYKVAAQNSPLSYPWLITVLGCLALFCYYASTRLNYTWHWNLLLDFIVLQTPQGLEPGLLIRGLLFTLRLGFWSMLLGLSLGLSLGILSAHQHGWQVLPISAYVNLIRNTPPLILLFIIYLTVDLILPLRAMSNLIISLPPAWQSFIELSFSNQALFDRMLAAVLTLGIYEGAYLTEIFRAGLEAVPKGQYEAAKALGFSGWGELRIILPQTKPLIMPAMVNQTISTFKDSALAALISLPELTMQSLETMAISRMTFEVWLTAGFIYFLLGSACSYVGKRLNNNYEMVHTSNSR